MVKETNADQGGFTTTSEGEEGTISEGGATAKFTNTRGVSTLTVSKTVDGAQGETGDPNKPWNFTVTMKDGETPLSGTFACVGTQTSLTFQAGKATFPLKHGQSITIQGIPAGVTYEVTEAEANMDGYETASEGETGTILEGGATAKFTNTKVPTNTLTVSKTVTGGGDTTKAWEFTVTLTRDDMPLEEGRTFNYDGGSIAAGVSEPPDGMLTLNSKGQATFPLKHGQSITIKDIPVWVAYQVTEQGANTGGYEMTSTNATGTIQKDIAATAAFTNTKVPSGTLTVTKTVSGNGVQPADRNKEWGFTVTMKHGETPLEGKFDCEGTQTSLSFNANGHADVRLKHGESITIQGIPAGVTYTVTEDMADLDGFKTTSTGATGTIQEGKAVTAAFTNTKNGDVTGTGEDTGAGTGEDTGAGTPVPQTGDADSPGLWLFLLALSAMGLTAVFLRAKRAPGRRRP